MAQRSTGRFHSIGAFLAVAIVAGVASGAAAKPISLAKARDQAAAEFVAETYPMTDELRARALAGKIGPYCNMIYPETATGIDSTSVDVPIAEQRAIAQAVDMAVVRQNLVAAGMDEGIAGIVAQTYRSDRQQFDGKSPEQQEALRQSGEDPLHHLLKTANFTGKLFNLPTFVDAGPCAHAAFAVHHTPYRFVTEPPGADVFVINRFSFRVCQQHLADPYSRHDCAAWVNVPQGGLARIGGLYEYSVEWPDGRRKRDRATFAYAGPDVTEVRFDEPPP